MPSFSKSTHFSFSATSLAPRRMRLMIFVRSLSRGRFLWKVTSSTSRSCCRLSNRLITGSPSVPVPTTWTTRFAPMGFPPQGPVGVVRYGGQASVCPRRLPGLPGVFHLTDVDLEVPDEKGLEWWEDFLLV